MTVERREGHARGTPAYRRLTIAMLFAGFSTFSLLYSTQSLLPLFAHDYHLNAEIASLALSIATGPLAIGILFAGVISDRLGRRPLMVFAMMAAGALTFLAAFVPGWTALLGLRLLTGIALAGVPAVAMAYVAEEVEGQAVGAAMGLYVAGSAIGGMSGRLIASLIAEVGGWRMAMGVVGAGGLIMAEAFRRLAPPSHRFTPSRSSLRGMGQLLRDPALLILYGEAFVLMGAFITLYNYAAFHLIAPPYALSQAAVGAIFLLYILGSASSAWFGALAGRIGRRRIFWIPIALLIAGVAISAARPLPLIILGIALSTIGFFGAHSIASAWVGRRAMGQRGQAASLYLFGYYAGSSILGSAGGMAWTALGWPGIAAFCGALGLLALAGAAALAFIPALPIPDPQVSAPVEP